MGFPGEGPGLLTNVKDWNGSQRYTVLFGQGLSVNALQAAGVFQTIANNGVRIPPRIVAATGDGKGGFTPARAAGSVKVVSPETAKQVRDMLEGVVGKEGTAPEAKIPGYRVAGKTGTADRYDARVGGYSRQDRQLHRVRSGGRPRDRRRRHAAAADQGLLRWGGRRPGVPGRHDLRAAGAADPAHRHDRRRWRRSAPDKTPAASDTTVLRDRQVWRIRASR